MSCCLVVVVLPCLSCRVSSSSSLCQYGCLVMLPLGMLSLSSSSWLHCNSHIVVIVIVSWWHLPCVSQRLCLCRGCMNTVIVVFIVLGWRCCGHCTTCWWMLIELEMAVIAGDGTYGGWCDESCCCCCCCCVNRGGGG